MESWRYERIARRIALRLRGPQPHRSLGRSHGGGRAHRGLRHGGGRAHRDFRDGRGERADEMGHHQRQLRHRHPLRWRSGQRPGQRRRENHPHRVRDV